MTVNFSDYGQFLETNSVLVTYNMSRSSIANILVILVHPVIQPFNVKFTNLGSIIE
jgi:hypothetical protein